MKPNPVGWFEIYVHDLARARSFYEAVFRTTLQPLTNNGPSMLAFPMDEKTGGAGGALVRMEGMPAGQGNSTIVYFACSDCAVEQGRVEGAGGTVQQAKKSIGAYGYIALVVDTEGNTIGLHSMM